jgi:excinuclease UvrABC ATPase subunit
MRGCGDEEIDVVWDHAVASEGGAQPHRWRQTFDGLAGEIDREYARKLADGRGHELEALLGPDRCEACGGDRLAVAGRSVAIAGVTLPSLCRQTIGEVLAGLPHLVPGDDPRREVADVVLPEVVRGLERLAGLGLAHLALDRSTDSLSVGERQRLRLARPARRAAVRRHVRSRRALDRTASKGHRGPDPSAARSRAFGEPGGHGRARSGPRPPRQTT